MSIKQTVPQPLTHLVNNVQSIKMLSLEKYLELLHTRIGQKVMSLPLFLSNLR